MGGRTTKKNKGMKNVRTGEDIEKRENTDRATKENIETKSEQPGKKMKKKNGIIYKGRKIRGTEI